MTLRAARTVVALIVLGVALPSQAQALSDPTRPPSAAGMALEGSGSVASGPVLQSILFSSGRRLAMIDGQMRKVGDRVGEARVVAIDYDSVKLRSGEGITVVKLLPDVQKTGAKPANSPVVTRKRSKDKSQ